VTDSSSKKPDWLRVRMPAAPGLERVREALAQHELHTVCFSAACPNLGECWSRGTATFMIGGNLCTRACGFCDVRTGRPAQLDPKEPEAVAEAVAKLGLAFAVVTCVARDDLADGGAGQMAATIRAIRARCPDTGIEVLISDYKGSERDLRTVLEARPTVLAHNVETVERLQRVVRPAAKYERSLEVLERATRLYPEVPTKSGIMLGLGEQEDEIERTLRELLACRVSLLTIGQYLSPSTKHLPVMRYVTPEEFEVWGRRARELGFTPVASGPLVRSSYRAETLAGCKPSSSA
jgi:lipoyl synthase